MGSVLGSAFFFSECSPGSYPAPSLVYILTVQQQVTSRPKSRKTVFPLHFQKVFPFALSHSKSRKAASPLALRDFSPFASTVFHNVCHQPQIMFNQLISRIRISLLHFL